jgi:hypothetical protein
VLLALLAISGTMANAPAIANCQFHPVASQWQGSCGHLFEQTPVITIAPAKAITTGAWRKDVHPASAWAGDMTDEEYTKAPIEIEIYDGGSGVLRTIYGWFPVTGFSKNARTLQFRLDPSHEVPPSELDRQIVVRAAAILSSPSVWNRSDNRKCPAGATSWSIYCAAEQATIDVTGAFSHRRPAMEAVRQLIDERSIGRNYSHRLMDYNNDPSTRFEDVQSLFAEALARMKN